MATMVALVVTLASCVVGPRPPSAWDILIKSEQINADDIQAYCYTKYATDELRCGQAQAKKQELQVMRTEMVHQRELKQAKAEREYARWAESIERQQAREEARKDREFAREMEAYQRCVDREDICFRPYRP